MPHSADLTQVKRLRDEGAQIVEVLGPESYAKVHIPGAVNLPLKQLDAASAAQLDRSKPIAVYCHDDL